MKPTKKELIKRLQYAKQRIVNNDDYFICHAVSEVDKDCVIRNWIKDQLDMFYDYGGWLHEAHPKFYKEHVNEDFRTGRIQWIDAMIQELQK